MKILYKLFVTLILFTTCYLSSVTAQSSTKLPLPKVDQRVELLSIVFRLAGSEEYSAPNNKNYVLDIHRHFDKFVNHPLIKYIKVLRDSNSVGYNAVMSMAIHLKMPPELDPIVPFSTWLPDGKWTIPAAEKFNALLKQFYKDADCRSFFQSQQNNYAIAEKQFLPLFKQVDVNWYFKFYGKAPNETFNIIIGLGNGGTNFGPHINLPDHPKKVYAIVGSSSFDSLGTPVYESKYGLPLLIHEFNHSFVNHLTDLNEKALDSAGKIIFEKEGDRMRRQKYPEWKVMMSEALVRAAVIQYLKEHDPDTLVADGELKNQLANGFVWMRSLVALLGQYEKQRSTYPTLESFMPRIVSYYNQVAPNIRTYDDDYNNLCARVISTEPFNNDTTVSSKITEIRFHFDKKLDGIRTFFGPGKKGIDHYSKPKGFTFTDDNKTIVMKIGLLRPNTDYQVNISGYLMKTSDGYAVQNYLLNFKTGD
ncbi:DUF4932 domain-containing protein [Mucilaginibacter sp. BJC16-A38]|uniref:DUF4932 domain-containing protein n=1 Tax=Mucilaginibacter phenanthrenivorans TaxID=1234842 RepID=UPI002157B19E|nr:DUF4932 domain-containing protein [Mucilaginibacter phenanthrenivorans]MCR8560868.1 DUF4932 domain-containing protein [Mucilaginibacter phenanthrenivorans]